MKKLLFQHKRSLCSIILIYLLVSVGGCSDKNDSEVITETQLTILEQIEGLYDNYYPTKDSAELAEFEGEFRRIFDDSIQSEKEKKDFTKIFQQVLYTKFDYVYNYEVEQLSDKERFLVIRLATVGADICSKYDRDYKKIVLQAISPKTDRYQAWLTNEVEEPRKWSGWISGITDIQKSINYKSGSALRSSVKRFLDLAIELKNPAHKEEVFTTTFNTWEPEINFFREDLSIYMKSATDRFSIKIWKKYGNKFDLPKPLSLLEEQITVLFKERNYDTIQTLVQDYKNRLISTNRSSSGFLEILILDALEKEIKNGESDYIKSILKLIESPEIKIDFNSDRFSLCVDQTINQNDLHTLTYIISLFSTSHPNQDQALKIYAKAIIYTMGKNDLKRLNILLGHAHNAQITNKQLIERISKSQSLSEILGRDTIIKRLKATPDLPFKYDLIKLIASNITSKDYDQLVLLAQYCNKNTEALNIVNKKGNEILKELSVGNSNLTNDAQTFYKNSLNNHLELKAPAELVEHFYNTSLKNNDLEKIIKWGIIHHENGAKNVTDSLLSTMKKALNAESPLKKKPEYNQTLIQGINFLIHKDPSNSKLISKILATRINSRFNVERLDSELDFAKAHDKIPKEAQLRSILDNVKEPQKFYDILQLLGTQWGWKEPLLHKALAEFGNNLPIANHKMLKSFLDLPDTKAIISPVVKNRLLKELNSPTINWQNYTDFIISIKKTKLIKEVDKALLDNYPIKISANKETTIDSPPNIISSYCDALEILNIPKENLVPLHQIAILKFDKSSLDNDELLLKHLRLVGENDLPAPLLLIFARYFDRNSMWNKSVKHYLRAEKIKPLDAEDSSYLKLAKAGLKNSILVANWAKTHTPLMSLSRNEVGSIKQQHLYLKINPTKISSIFDGKFLGLEEIVHATIVIKCLPNDIVFEINWKQKARLRGRETSLRKKDDVKNQTLRFKIATGATLSETNTFGLDDFVIYSSRGDKRDFHLLTKSDYSLFLLSKKNNHYYRWDKDFKPELDELKRYFWNSFRLDTESALWQINVARLTEHKAVALKGSAFISNKTRNSRLAIYIDNQQKAIVTVGVGGKAYKNINAVIPKGTRTVTIKHEIYNHSRWFAAVWRGSDNILISNLRIENSK